MKSNPNDGVQLFTVAEVAPMLKCSVRKVFELLEDGTLVRGAKYGRETTVLAESVFHAMEKQYDPPAPPKRRRIKKGVAAEFELLLINTRGRARRAAKTMEAEHG